MDKETTTKIEEWLKQDENPLEMDEVAIQYLHWGQGCFVFLQNCK